MFGLSIRVALLTLVLAGCGTASVPSTHPEPSAPPASVAPNVTPSQPPATDFSTPSADPVAADGEPWIAYQQSASGGRYGVHLVRPDGTGLHFALPDIPGRFQEHPDWSPDGRRLALSETEADEQTEDLWIAEVDGSNAKRVVDCQTLCVWADEPAWSPDGGSIVFQRTVARDGVRISTIELLDVGSASVRTVLTAPHRKTFYAPRWSPDGRSLVVEYATDGATIDDPPTANSIAIVDLRVPKPAARPITDARLLGNNPDWSPRGDLIVFSLPAPDAGFDGPADLFVISPDGTGMRSLTSFAAKGGRAYQPTFTPDGTRILFVREATTGAQATMASVLIDGSGLASATGPRVIAGVHPRLRPTP